MINQLMLIKWLCDEHEWVRKHMYTLSCIIGKDFTSLDLPYKNSRSHELLKEWLSKGLVRIVDYTKKARVYHMDETLFAEVINKKDISHEDKQELLNKIDEII